MASNLSPEEKQKIVEASDKLRESMSLDDAYNFSEVMDEIQEHFRKTIVNKGVFNRMRDKDKIQALRLRDILEVVVKSLKKV